jgi:hypothetical protein
LFALKTQDFVLIVNKLGLGAAGEQTARLIFSQIDTNNNGVLELSEAMRAFEQVKKLLAMANKTPAVPAATTS